MQDPACTVGAGICQKVLQTHPQIGKPGATMVLRDVTFLKMSHVPYLCITPANIAQVKHAFEHFAARLARFPWVANSHAL